MEFKIEKYFRDLLYSAFIVIVMWISIFGGSVSIELKNPFRYEINLLP